MTDVCQNLTTLAFGFVNFSQAFDNNLQTIGQLFTGKTIAFTPDLQPSGRGLLVLEHEDVVRIVVEGDALELDLRSRSSPKLRLFSPGKAAPLSRHS